MPTAEHDPDPITGDVLELRIHGVNNTAPASMLDLPADAIEEVLGDGDNLAGFWRPKKGALDNLGRNDRGWVPEGVTREVYSWGGLARFAPGSVGSGTLQKAASALVRVGWSLLLPFGLANVAYWTRRLGDEDAAPIPAPPGGRLRHAKRVALGRSRGGGAGLMRVFGVGLTAFTVVTFCEISMDMVGSQCFRDGARVCGRLPGLLNWLASLTPASRLVVTSLVPLLVLAGLGLLSAVTRSRYERAFPEAEAALEDSLAEEEPPRIPLLATPGFWQGDRMVGGLATLHLAVGFAVVSIALAWPALFGTGAECSSPTTLLSRACRDQVAGQPDAAVVLFWASLAGATAVLVWALYVTVRRAVDAPDVAGDAPGEAENVPGTVRAQPKRPFWLRSRYVLISGAIVLVFTEVSVLAISPDLSTSIPLPGVSALPTILAVVLFIIVAAAFTARLGRYDRVAAAALAITFALTVVWPWAALATLAALAALAAYVLKADGGLYGDRRWTAWGGTGPGILLGAAFLVQGMLGSLAVLGAGDWLNGTNSASSLLDERATAPLPQLPTDACGRSCPAPDPMISAPLPYVLFGTATVLTVLIVLLVVLVMLWRTRNPQLEAARAVEQPERVELMLKRKRRSAAVAHRAEKLVALLVLVGLALTFPVLLFSISDKVPWEEQRAGNTDDVLRWGTDFGTLGVAFLALAVLGGLVGGAAAGKTRPLGLVWDLICFVPRAAHPFGPPCYAERAVPELSSRVGWWLAHPDRVVAGRRRGGARVILSAHSLGGVLAVAVLVASMLRPFPVGTIRLLTYGSQLRAYFGRIFPELLGPLVLGTPSARAALLFAKDPWCGDKAERERLPAGPTPTLTVVALLTPPPPGRAYWRNLWRRTDYLGFPLSGYEANRIDEAAEEIDSTGYLVHVVTHSDYPRARAYLAALEDLASVPSAGTAPAGVVSSGRAGTGRTSKVVSALRVSLRAVRQAVLPVMARGWRRVRARVRRRAGD